MSAPSDGLAAVLTDRGRYAESESLLVGAHRVTTTGDDADPRGESQVAWELVRLYEVQGRPEDADLYREAAKRWGARNDAGAPGTEASGEAGGD